MSTAHSEAGPAGWLFVRADDVPEDLSERAVPAAFIPLFPDEVQDMLERRRAAAAGLDERDLEIVTLLARGTPLSTIARRLHVGDRTVDRRLQRLRDRFGVSSSAELTAVLAQQGFGR